MDLVLSASPHAGKILLTYPSSKVNIVDVFERPRKTLRERAISWWKPSGTNGIEIQFLSVKPVDSISIAFTLKSGQAPATTSEFFGIVEGANATGTPIAGINVQRIDLY